MEKKLNENQKIAIAHEDGAMMVLAGPGSGKTTVIINRVKNLINKMQKENNNRKVLVVTYTKASSVEMKERFASSKDYNSSAYVEFSTFHGLCFKVVRKAYNLQVGQVISGYEQKMVLTKLLNEVTDLKEDIEDYITQFLSQLSYMTNELLDIENFEPVGISKNNFVHLMEGYKAYKKERKKMDFDDMLYWTHRLFSKNKELDYWKNQFAYYMVDEFQDINRIQYEILKFLVKPTNNILVVGDDDQSIYGFRGARPDFLLEFTTTFPECKKVTLNENYRFHNGILTIADFVICNNKNRFEKNLITNVDFSENDEITIFKEKNSSDESKVICNKIEEYIKKGMELKDIAIIYRTNIQNGSFAIELRKRKIPFSIKDNNVNIYEHWVVKDLLAYIEVGIDIKNSEAVSSIINKPKRYISKEVITKAKDNEKGILEGIIEFANFEDWQLQNFIEAKYDIEAIKGKSPHDAIDYIRKILKYDDYIIENANYRKINKDTAIGIANEITQLSKKFNTFQELIDGIKELSEEIKNEKKSSKKIENNENVVTLTTMHGAKGLEFTAVFLPGLIEDVIPHKKNNNIEEERRLFYVGVTRAKSILHMSYIEELYDESVNPSIFLLEIESGLANKIKKNKEDNKQ